MQTIAGYLGLPWSTQTTPKITPLITQLLLKVEDVKNTMYERWGRTEDNFLIPSHAIILRYVSFVYCTQVPSERTADFYMQFFIYQHGLFTLHEDELNSLYLAILSQPETQSTFYTIHRHLSIVEAQRERKYAEKMASAFFTKPIPPHPSNITFGLFALHCRTSRETRFDNAQEIYSRHYMPIDCDLAETAIRKRLTP